MFPSTAPTHDDCPDCRYDLGLSMTVDVIDREHGVCRECGETWHYYH